MAFSMTSFRSALPGLHSCGCSRATAQPAARSFVRPVIEAAHKKGAGSTKNGRDSKSKRRGVKVYGGQPIQTGAIIMRQLGTKFHPGNGVGLGKDYTLFAMQEGIVSFHQTKYKKEVSVIPFEEYERPAGQQMKPGSRKSRRKEQYPPRALLRAAAAEQEQTAEAE